MKKNKLNFTVVVVLSAVTVSIILRFAGQITDLKTENEHLRAVSSIQVSSTDNAAIGGNEIVQAASPGYHQKASLEEENERLRGKVNSLRQELARMQEDQKKLEDKVDELLKPLDADILSSTLKTTIAKGEILVTGGYQTADGNFQYAMVEPTLIELDDGQTAISMQTRQYAIKPYIVNELGLNSLSTSAGNTLQHGEIWTAAEIIKWNENVANSTDIELVASPNLVLYPGSNAEIQIGEYKISTTPTILEDNSGFDIELRIEQPR